MFAFYEGAQKRPKVIFGQCTFNLLFSGLLRRRRTPNHPIGLGVAILAHTKPSYRFGCTIYWRTPSYPLSLGVAYGCTPSYPLSLGVPCSRAPLSAAPSALESHQIMSSRFCFALLRHRNCGDSRALPPVRILTLP